MKASVKVLPGGDFEASLDVDGEKKVVVVKNNFTLADSCIDAVIDGNKSHVVQLVNGFLCLSRKHLIAAMGEITLGSHSSISIKIGIGI